MLRILATVLLFAFSVPGANGQDARGTLRITVALRSADGTPLPVPRHVLLISDNPPTAPPRRVQTALDGTASVRLPPGNYTIESDQPVTIDGTAFQWMQIVDIAPGRDAVLDLTAGNAEAAPAASAGSPASGDSTEQPSSLLIRWQASVVPIWSPTARATGFAVDDRGLIVTTARAVGAATSAEVQITPALKVAARVLAADSVRDVAVLRIDPGAMAGVRPVPPGCAAQGGVSRVEEGQAIFAIEAPLRRSKGTSASRVSAVEGRFIASSLVLSRGGAGGPVFGPGGVLIGMTSVVEEREGSVRQETRVVRVEEVCASLASAELKMSDVPAPDGAPLPTEPSRPFPVDALNEAARRTLGDLTSYRVASPSFDVLLITPPLAYAAQHQPRRANERTGVARDPRTIDPLEGFGNWSGYVAEFPPVLLIRATPKLVEGFWAKVARGAARTQGATLPPLTRFTPGFARMQAFCGEVEVTPIHPFRIEQRLSETDGIFEGLYVFDPDALGPGCGTVTLVLYSEKEPQKGDRRVVDPAVLQQIWTDFAPYRAQQ